MSPHESDAARDHHSRADANEPLQPANASPEDQIRGFLELLFAPGDIFEVRVPKCAEKPGGRFKSTTLGYYQHEQIPKAARDIAHLDASGRAPGIYVCLNPVAPALLARSLNALKDRAEEATADGEIERRNWMLVDADPVRVKGVSSTDQELDLALAKAEQIKAFLTGLGWPEPLEGMSGNGGHLLYLIALPAADDGLIERVLKALAQKFSDAAVTIDTSVGNAARITKLMGTMARKGTHMAGIEGIEARPHRRSHLRRVPEALAPVPAALLASLAAQGGPPPATPPRTKSDRSVGLQGVTRAGFDTFDHTAEGVTGYLQRHGFVITGQKRDVACTKLFLDRCPVDPSCTAENGTDIAVLVFDTGKIAYKNQHSRGAGLTWVDVREAFEPGYRDFVGSVGDRLAAAAVRVVARVQLQACSRETDGRIVVSAVSAAGLEIARDTVNQNSAISRARFINEVVDKAGLEPSQAEELDRALRELAPPPPPGSSPRTREALLAERDQAVQEALDRADPDVVGQARSMLSDPRLIDLAVDDITAAGVVGEQVLGLTLYIEGVSRLLDDPTSGIVQGTSSSGKSHVIATVAGMFPDEAVLLATDLTANALYYLPQGSLLHRLVVGGERPRIEDDQKAEAKRSMREMISARELRKWIPLKQPDGSFQTSLVHQFGPIAFLESTTTTRLFDEDANRCLLLSSDETPEQTARVMAAAARAAREGGSSAAAVLARHQALQRLLRRVTVRVPYAEALAATVPPQRPEARRAFNQVLGMIKAVALLHQRQRAAGPVGHGDTIQAAVADYIVARRLLSGPLGRSLGGSLPEAVARFGHRLLVQHKSQVFSSTEALENDEILSSKSKVNDYLKHLAEAGVVECVEESKGAKPSQWQVIGPVPEPGAAWLPTVDALEGFQ